MKREVSVKRKRNPVIIFAIALLCIILVVGVGCFIFVQDYYRADLSAIEVYGQNFGDVVVETMENGYMVFQPEEAKVGIIFYPGGKVEYSSYAPLMMSLAKEGVLGILVEMPANLAMLDMDAAEGLPELFPEVKEWYMAGHSLGGSMAASYVAENSADYEGLILLGSYSITDISEVGLDILSIYGSEDKVLNYENYEANKVNLPADFVEEVIEGGCHAGFGMYGAQEGDGIPTITTEQQIAETTYLIVDILLKR